MTDTHATLCAIRADMVAAMRRKDKATYERLAADHRRILHAAVPEKKAAWERCVVMLPEKDRRRVV